MANDDDALTPSKSLSEIGHLFLSSIREKHTGGSPLPKRVPPGQRALAATASDGAGPREIAIDLTPEEFAQVFGEPEVAAGAAAPATEGAGHGDDELRIPPVTALIGTHLNGRQFDRVKEYARHLAGGGQRVGLIEVDGSEFRVTCFDQMPHEDGQAAVSGDEQTCDHFDARQMTDAIDELSWDLDRWLLVAPNLREPEARALLREVSHWVLLSTCDHDGVVSCYRTLKGLGDAHRPRLSLGLLDARDDREAHKIYRKLSNVCLQFLGWELLSEDPVRPAAGVAEHLVTCCRLARSKADLANAPQWRVVANFLRRANAQREAREAVEARRAAEIEASWANDDADDEETETAAPMASQPTTDVKESKMDQNTQNEPAAESREMSAAPEAFVPRQPVMREVPPPPAAVATAPAYPRISEAVAPRAASAEESEVIDLPDGQVTSASILAGILRSEAGLVECPVVPPMCPDARLAVTRDRRLVLLAVARQGLGDLRAVGRAYRWLIENMALIGMAVPQMAIDAKEPPRLRLLVDHADLTAEVLQPMLQSSTVTVQAYRRLRWGGRTGLLLEAA